MSNDVKQEGQEAVLLAFSNDKDEQHLGILRGLLKMVYHTVLTNRLAIMEAKNVHTGEIETILVGVEQTGNGLNCYPLFKPITDTESAKYASPDGKGGFLEREVEQALE